MSERDTGYEARQRQPAELIDALLELLARPRAHDFYTSYAVLVQALCRTDAVLVLDAAGLEGPQDRTGHNCRMLGEAGAVQDLENLATQFTAERWRASEAQGYTHELYRKSDGLGAVMLLVRLLDTVPSALLMCLPERDRAHIKEALVRALLVKDLRPTQSLTREVAPLAEPTSQAGLLDMLGLATEVLRAPRFSAATLALVNGAVRTLGLLQAVLCWRLSADAEVLAISHSDRF